MAPSLEAYANTAANKTALIKINVDQHPELSEQFGVRSIPAFFLYDAQGKQTLSGTEARQWVSKNVPMK